jgi:hypothetical protein
VGAENANLRTQKARKKICEELIQHSETGKDAFLSKIITGDETWVHHYDPLTKRQSMKSHHQSSPRKKNFQGVDFCG